LGDHSKEVKGYISIEANDEEDEDPHKRPEGQKLAKKEEKKRFPRRI
jgi:hypothetical protein